MSTAWRFFFTGNVYMPRFAPLRSSAGNFAPPPDQINAVEGVALARQMFNSTPSTSASYTSIPGNWTVDWTPNGDVEVTHVFVQTRAGAATGAVLIYADAGDVNGFVHRYTLRPADMYGREDGGVIPLTPLLTGGAVPRVWQALPRDLDRYVTSPSAPLVNPTNVIAPAHHTLAGPGTIYGTTTLEGELYPHCPVWVLDERTKHAVASGASDAHGQYRFRGLPMRPVLVVGEDPQKTYNHVTFARVMPVDLGDT